MTGRPQLIPSDWTSRHAPTWKRWLADFVGRDGVRALEIGVCAGLTSEWLCRNVLTGKNCSLDCVDHWQQYEAEEAQFDERVKGYPVRKLKGNSDAILPRLKIEGNRYSVIYVDGGHHGENVLYDLVLGWSMVCKGGILFADDYAMTARHLRIPPKTAIDGWLACIADSMQGYELSPCGQAAAWKRL